MRRSPRDIRTLVHWRRHDVLALAGPALATRQDLFDFIVEKLARREPGDARRIYPVRVALQNQRDTLLAFAGVLDDKLAGIAQANAIAEPRVREACLPPLAQHLARILAGMELAPSGDGMQVPHAVRRDNAGHDANTAQQFSGGEP